VADRGAPDGAGPRRPRPQHTATGRTALGTPRLCLHAISRAIALAHPRLNRPPPPTQSIRLPSPLERTVDNTPISDALALRATASAFDAQRGKLPV
ncbi:hypothetical protein RB628_41950, partial [Streptomyces sp. ADMS]|nr:hypothetical protein [Streptomyces sp. ADMS]